MTVSNPSAGASATVYDEGLRRHMTRTYSLIAQGLALTAAGAWLASGTGLLDAMRGPEGMTGLGWALMLAPLGLLLVATFGGAGRALAGSRAIYWAFVALQGPALGLAVSQYTGASVVQAAAAAAVAFGAASLYGYTTSRRLEGMGTFMLMGLIGIVVAALLNVFLGSPALDFAISAIAVVVFTGLAAWETQAIKDAYGTFDGEDSAERARYVAALGLYLDVINIFLALLNLTGDHE